MAENYLIQHFDNAREFLEHIRLSRDEWWDDTNQNPQKEPAWVFRGMADSHWHLLPTGLRPIDEHSDNSREQERFRLFERVKTLPAPPFYNIPNISDSPFQRNTRILWNRFIYEGIFQFINHVINSGYRLEYGSRWESIFSDDFNFSHLDQAQGVMKVHPISCGLAQHHGIPTYLLDWTLNPLFAAFFACESWLDGNDIAVWAFCDKAYRKYYNNIYMNSQGKIHLNVFLLWGSAGDNAILRPSPSSNQYLHTQQGVFTWVMGECDETVNTEDTPLHKIKWKGADEIVRDFSPIPLEQQFLQKITLSAAEVPKLKDLLYREGITRAALMPSLDNMALTVRSRW